jgi:hypothetical protein
MWGSTQTVNVVGTTIGSYTAVSAQLARISYARPETWRFFFAAKIIDGVTTQAGPLDIIVDFALTFGVGRSQITLAPAPGQVPAFKRFRFSWTGAIPIGKVKFSNSTNGPVDEDTAVAPFPPNVINSFSAQDVQLSANVTFIDGTATDRATVEISAFFSPEVHIRPEWFLRQFPGGEDKGGAL